MKKISCLVIAITLILTLLGGCAVTPATSGSPTITPECNTGRVTQSPTAGVSATPTLTVTSTPTVIPSPLITPSSSATVSSEDEDIVYLDYQALNFQCFALLPPKVVIGWMSLYFSICSFLGVPPLDHGAPTTQILYPTPYKQQPAE